MKLETFSRHVSNVLVCGLQHDEFSVIRSGTYILCIVRLLQCRLVYWQKLALFLNMNVGKRAD